MILRGLFAFAFALIGWCGTNGQAQADEQLSYQRQQNLSYFGMGLGGVSISSSETSLSSLAFDVSYRHAIQDTPFSILVLVAPILQSTNLFGLQATAGIGYQVYGTTQIATQYSDQGQVVISQSTPDSEIKGFVDAGISVLPVFGSNSTASYSGIFGDVSAYSSKYRLNADLQINMLTLGARSVTTLGLFLNYYWNLRE